MSNQHKKAQKKKKNTLTHQWSGLCIGLTQVKTFVTVGQSVKKAILVYFRGNENDESVQAESDGKIIEILVDNAEPVEFDQPLFVIND